MLLRDWGCILYLILTYPKLGRHLDIQA
jgi:hypothetical protein